MQKYIQIQIQTASQEETDILIATLSGISFYAFEEENNLLNAYVYEEYFDEEKLRETLPATKLFTKNIIEETNWNQQWESLLEPVIINQYVAIRPSFHEPINEVKHDLIITPKMSFGTGHHPTTFLMVEIMEMLDFKNKTVVDFGTGTGVLSILAEKSGTSKIFAVDYDEWSIHNAKENMEENHCGRIILKQQNDLSGLEPADIILANINLNVIKENAMPLSSLLNKNGFLVISGFLSQDEAEIETIFEKYHLIKSHTRQCKEWVVTLLKKL